MAYSNKTNALTTNNNESIIESIENMRINEIRDLLSKNFKLIITRLPTNALSPDLVQKGILTLEDMELLDSNPSEIERSKRLLYIILKKPLCEIKHFVLSIEQVSPFLFEEIFQVEEINHNDKVPGLIKHFGGLFQKNTKSQANNRHSNVKEWWELNNDDVELRENIGRGKFGEVFKGIYTPSGVEIAVKILCKTDSVDMRKRFLQEADILKQYDHPNIVKLIGIACTKEPIMIVKEMIPDGQLLAFLKKENNKLQEDEMTQMCEMVACGMAYLEDKKCILRDLAARNCLITSHRIVKLSNFGMSQQGSEYVDPNWKQIQVPIRWTAPEAMQHGRYTYACDVWSFGILMWEIFSRGSTPYSSFNNNQARQIIDNGYRMPAPGGTPDVIYQLMLRCWSKIPEARPHFDEIEMKLGHISTDSTNDNLMSNIYSTLSD